MPTILAIETSCDETAAALVEGDGSRPLLVRSNALASQAALHTQYGGVFPEMAAREHSRRILSVIGLALYEAGLLSDPEARGERVQRAFDAIDAIAVTVGPGLIGPLLIGTNTAAQLANLTGKPVIPVNHWEGHLYSVFLEKTERRTKYGERSMGTIPATDSHDPLLHTSFSIPQFPLLALTVSGGHTSLILMRDHFRYEVLGSTVDDAAGEAFDKCARMLGLGYPGGAALSHAATSYRARDGNAPGVAHGDSPGAKGERLLIDLPRPMLHSGDLRFSFSGLKTAVRYAIDRGEIRLPDDVAPAAAAIEDAIVDVLLSKLERAIEPTAPASVAIVGGVSANSELRRRAMELVQSKREGAKAEHASRFTFHMPEGQYCTDNAAMIGAAGLFRFLRHEGIAPDPTRLDANASLRLTV